MNEHNDCPQCVHLTAPREEEIKGSARPFRFVFIYLSQKEIESFLGNQ